MPKKKKPGFPVPDPQEWKTMFAGMGLSKNGKQYYKPNKEGWSKIFGDIDLVSASIKTDKVQAEGTKKKYLARFLTPMSGVMQIVQTEIKPGKRYEVGYKASTNSTSGFLATTVTFLSDNGAPMGIPSSGGVKLSTVETDTYTPVSFVAGPAPEGAAKVQLAFVVFGMERDKFVDIDKVSFKGIT